MYDPANPDEATVTEYTCGGCAELALAVEELTGWPAYGYWQEGGIDVHVFNRLPNGMRLDILGPRFKRIFDPAWVEYINEPGRMSQDKRHRMRHMRVKRVDWPELHATWGNQTPCVAARRVAAKLVAHVRELLDIQ